MSVYTFREFYIPERMMGGIERYIKYGIPPGDFLMGIFQNDLMKCVGRADEENMKNIPAYVGYLYNNAPIDCYGNKKIVKAWMKRKHKEREVEDE